MVNIITKILTQAKNSIEFDSGEEGEFYEWCEEAKEHGFLKSFEYHPPPFLLCGRTSREVDLQLKTKTKKVEQFLFNPHEYTPDFLLVPTEKLEKLSHKMKITDGSYWVDVKGTFSMHNDQKSFSINQKWVYQKFGVVINKVVPKKFFPLTWVPESSRYTEKRRELKKCYLGCPTIKDVT